MKKVLITALVIISFTNNIFSQLFLPEDYCLAWSDEFNVDGAPNSANWSYEQGCSIRNGEAQFYTNNRRENARVENGKLILEARREMMGNCNYTSASLITSGKKVFRYGRFEMRAKIDARVGSWPAFWTLGTSGEWPSNGEIDIMEFYNKRIHANVAWGTETRWSAKWDSQNKLVSEMGSNWANDFHVWRMEWTPEFINLYVDDMLMNSTNLSQTINGSISPVRNPFLQTHYIVINQAIGGVNGGDPANTTFPIRYEIDYVRVYQKGNCNLDCNWQEGGSAEKDDCLLCAGGTTGKDLCTITCSGNLLSNPGFETGGLAGWTGWGTRAAGTTAYSGNAGVTVDNGAIERVVNVEPNMTYTLRAKGQKTGTGWYRLGAKEAGNGETYTERSNTGWGDVVHNFTTENSTTARIYFYNGGGGRSYGDDFDLQPAGCLTVTGMENELPAESLKVYPNPSANAFELKVAKPGKIQVYNMMGVILTEVNVLESFQFGAGLPAGTYYIRYISSLGARVVKWVKM